MRGLAAKLICCLCSYEWVLGFPIDGSPGSARCPKCGYESFIDVSQTYPYFERNDAAFN